MTGQAYQQKALFASTRFFLVPSAAVGKIFQLEEFQLEPDKRLLSRDDGAQVRLAQRPFQVLLYLIENRDRIVARDELLERFWDGREVYDEALTKCVGAIRKALNDQLEHPRFIETRWAEGYRFIGPIEEHPADELSFVASERTREVKIIVEEEHGPEPPAIADGRQDCGLAIADCGLMKSILSLISAIRNPQSAIGSTRSLSQAALPCRL